MAFQVSPGVLVRDIDLTNIVPAVSTSIGAMAGEFSKGPVGEKGIINVIKSRKIKPLRILILFFNKYLKTMLKGNKKIIPVSTIKEVIILWFLSIHDEQFKK